MKRYLDFLEQRFWIILVVGAILGVLLPGGGEQILGWLEYVTMSVLLIVFLRIDLRDLFSHIKQPVFQLYLVIMCLLVVPTVLYLLALPFGQDISLSVLLLTSMPAGVASAALTGAFKGNATLSVVITVLTSLIAPLTVPFLFGVLTTATVDVSYWDMAGTLARVIFIPLIISQPIRFIAGNWIDSKKQVFSIANMVFVGLLIFTAISLQRDVYLHNPGAIIIPVIVTSILFASVQAIGYNVAWWREKVDKIAISSSFTYINLSIAILLAAKFLGKDVLLYTAAAEIPWTIMPMVFSTVIRKIK